MPKIIAHRGASSEITENTLPAIKRALELKVDAVEMDIHLTKDKIPILFHDNTLSRLGSRDERIWDLNWDELKQVELLGGHRIALLEEVLQLDFGNTTLFLELKCEDDKGSPDPTYAVLELLRPHAKRAESERIVIGSYNVNCLLKARQQWPSLSLLGIADTDVEANKLLKALDLKRIALWYEYYTPMYIENLREAGISPWTFTVDSPEKARFLAHIGVEAIITNDPRAMQKFFKEE